MKLASTFSAAAVTLALIGGMASTSALAEVPKAPKDIAAMDTNKNGRIEKDEYVTAMTAEFEKTAGSKGYCTFEEVAEGWRQRIIALERNP